MRILYFTERDSPHDRRFLTALAGTEHQVFSLRMHPCEPHTPAEITELSWPEGLPDWSHWHGWQAGKTQLQDIVDRLQPDVVHAGPIQGPAMVAALTGFHPLVTMSWAFDLLRIANRSPWTRFATTITLESTDLLLTDCETVSKKAVERGFREDKIVSFPWGVDLAYFSQKSAGDRCGALRRSLGWENQFVIFCNRSWAKQYGVDLLARAFVRAYRRDPTLRLILAGDGPQKEEIYAILAPVKEAVYLPGWVELEDLPPFYGAGDLFISSSHVDGSSISVLEALACGRPVLTSDIPSNREWVIPTKTGNLFIDGDIMSLENKILSMVGDENLAYYGEQARLLAEERANWAVNFQKLLGAYQITTNKNN